MKRLAGKLKAPRGLALAIFVAIVIVALAQITWWVYFQIMISREQIRVLNAETQSSARLTAALLNRYYDRLEADAAAFVNIDNPGNLKSAFDHLLTDSSVCGYHITDSLGHNIGQQGTVDSSFYLTVLGTYHAVLYFNRQYPVKLIAQLSPDLDLLSSSNAGAPDGPRFDTSMFRIKPASLAAIQEKGRRRVVMFAMEGSFFVLLTLLGAFMIYRTLHQSEELKLRQENFIHAVTHEFKIPVASIKLYLETMLSHKIDRDKCQAIIPRMMDDCGRLERLVDNVLEAGRLTRQTNRLKLVSANLSLDLEEYLEELFPMIERQRMKLRKDIEPDLFIRSDYHALRRVVVALVDNAIKYSPEDRRESTITVKRYRDDCILRFSDHGVGIDVDEQKKVFDLFYRTGMESTRSVKGTGLGLFLVREIVMEHGGTVKIDSEGVDKGSTFIITLPLDKQA